MITPFTQWAEHYIDWGYSPLPVAFGFKHPSFNGHSMKNWSIHCTEVASERRIAQWKRAGNLGICLAMGFNGLIGVDVDDPRAYAAVREVFGSRRAPYKVGQRGATAFFCDPTGKITTKIFRAANPNGSIGGALVEILGWGRQSVIPPTIHCRTNRPYEWHRGSLAGEGPSALPRITQDDIAALGCLLGPLSYHPKSIEISDTAKRKVEIEEFERRRYEAYGSKAIDNTLRNLAGQGAGSRNEALFRAACAISWVTRTDPPVMSAEELAEKLLAACRSNGLVKDNGEPDTKATIARAFKRTANEGIPELKERAM